MKERVVCSEEVRSELGSPLLDAISFNSTRDFQCLEDFRMKTEMLTA